MSNPPETVLTETRRVKCDGATDISPALGHPRVWLEIDEADAIVPALLAALDKGLAEANDAAVLAKF